MGDFFQSLLGDATSLAGVATQAGGAAIASDISGQDYVAPVVIQQQGGPIVTAHAASSSSSFILILVIIFLVVMIEK